MFAVGEPFLEDLVAAKFVVSDVGGDVLPVGAAVEVDVVGGLAEDGHCRFRVRRGVGGGGLRVGEGVWIPAFAGMTGESIAFFGGIGAFDCLALAGHDGFAAAKVPPAGGEGKVVAGHVAVVGGGGLGDGDDLRSYGSGGDAGHGGVGVEEVGQLAAAGGGFGKYSRRVGGRMDSRFHGNDGLIRKFGPAGQGDARPYQAQCAGILPAVGGVVEHGEGVVEEIFYAFTQAVEILLCGRSQIGPIRCPTAV